MRRFFRLEIGAHGLPEVELPLRIESNLYCCVRGAREGTSRTRTHVTRAHGLEADSLLALLPIASNGQIEQIEEIEQQHGHPSLRQFRPRGAAAFSSSLGASTPFG